MITITAGNQYTADTINQNAAAAIVELRNAFAALMVQYNWLNQLGSAGIQAAPTVGGKPAISAVDAGNILSALTDLAGLAQFFNGQAVTLGFGASHVSGTYNHMTFGQLLTNGQ